MLVVPLRMFGSTRSWTLRRSGDRLVSRSRRLCGFVAMQGDGASAVRYIDLADGVHLRLDEGEQIDEASLDGILSQPRKEAWAGISLPPRTALPDLDMWLAIRLREEFVMLSAQDTAIASGIVAPAWQHGTPAALHDGTFTYRSALRWTDRRFDLGAYAHGPDAEAAAGRMVEHMLAWVEEGSPIPVLSVLPARTPDGDLPDGAVLDKRHSRLVLAFTPEEEKETP